MQSYLLHMPKTDCIASKISMHDTTSNLHLKQLNSGHGPLKISVYLRLLHDDWFYSITPTYMHIHMLFLFLQLALLLLSIGTCSHALTVFMAALRACKHFVLCARITIAGQRSNILQCPCVCVCQCRAAGITCMLQSLIVKMHRCLRGTIAPPRPANQSQYEMI